MNCFLGLDALHVLGMPDSVEVEVACNGDEEDNEDEDNEDEEDEEQADDDAGDVKEEAAIWDRDVDWEAAVVTEFEPARFPSDIRRNRTSWSVEEDAATDVSLNNASCSSNRAKSSSGSPIKSSRASSSSSPEDCNNLSAARWSLLVGVVEVNALSNPVLTGEHLWLPNPELEPDDWPTLDAVLLAWRRWRVK